MDYYNNETQPQNHPMKWYKFVIYIQLFFSSVSYLFVGLTYFNGMHYGELSSSVYAYWGMKLKAVDMFMAISNLGVMVYMLYTRHCLTLYKKGAPKRYLLCYVFPLAIELIYRLGRYLVIGTFSFYMQDLLLVIESVICISLNYIYFKKRADLFVY